MRKSIHGAGRALGLALGAALLATGCAAPGASLRTTRSAPQPRWGALLAEAAVAALIRQAAPEPARPSPAEEVEALFAQGAAAFEAGDLDGAQEAFEAAAKRHPQEHDARFNLGVVAERRGELDTALGLYREVLEASPGHRPSLLNLGRLLGRLRRWDEAIALYEAALARPELAHEPGLLNNLSAVYRLAGRIERSEAAARRVLLRNPEDADAYKNLARVYYRQERYRLAELMCAKAQRLRPGDPGVFNTLGLIALRQEDTAGALRHFRKAVELDAGFVPGHLNLGALALSHRDYAAAAEAFAQGARLEPTSAEAQLYLAYALEGLGAQEPARALEAGAAYERALALSDPLSQAVCGAGLAYGAVQEGWERAKPFLERCKTLKAARAEDRQLAEARLETIRAMERGAQPSEQGSGDDPGGDAGEIAGEEARPSAEAGGLGGSGVAPAGEPAPAPLRTAGDDEAPDAP